MDWSSFISGLGWGGSILYWILLRYCKIERKHPYKWSCPEEGCFFRISTNVDYNTIMRMADSHSRAHQES